MSTDRDRRASIFVDPRWLIQMLELPDDVAVVAVIGESDPLGIRVVVTKPDLPVVPPDSMAPPVHQMVTIEGDKRTVTYLWPDDE